MSKRITSEQSRDSQLSSLRRIVEQLRINLYTLEEQAAHYGPLDTPLRLRNGIEETTRQLEQKEAQLRELQSSEGSKLPQNIELKRFWEPFVIEGVKFYVTQEAPDTTSDTRMMVLTLTMQAIFSTYRLLIEQFVETYDMSQIRLEIAGINKNDTKLERLPASTHPHMIVIGAPGANILSNYLMAQFKGITPNTTGIVRQGYIFRIAGDYLGSPFIVSNAELKRYPLEEQALMQNPGIYDLRPDQPPLHFPRTSAQYGVPGPQDKDCALILTGWASLPGENRIRRVVVVAGHSRHSTMLGAIFITTNEEWARQVNSMNYFNTETIIGLQPDTTGTLTLPSILAGPREIYKHSA